MRPTRIRDYKMKLFLKISLILIGIIGVMALASCEKDEVKSLVAGKVVATPSTVKNGDEITLEIGGNVSASGETIIMVRIIILLYTI